MTNLSSREHFLLFLTVVVVGASIALSLSIGLILPDYMTVPNTVSNWDNKSTTELKVMCGCSPEKKKITPSKNCKLYDVPIKDGNKSESQFECEPDQTKDELMKSFSYLGSLTVPAYVDQQNERRLACSCTIITESLILVGKFCIQNNKEEDLNMMELRVGSIYWSKCGTKIRGLSYFHEYRDIQLYRIKTNIYFNEKTAAVQLPIPGTYRTVSSMVTLNWETGKLHNSFNIKNWTKNFCKNFNTVGEIINDFYMVKKVDSLALVSVDKLLIGFLDDIDNFGGKIRYWFSDLQCDTYPSWLLHSISTIPGPFLPEYTKCHPDKSVIIYEGKNCHYRELITNPPKTDTTIEQDIFEPITFIHT